MTSLQRRGIHYENKVTKKVGRIFNGAGVFYDSQWIEFSDANGYGCAQPDCFVVARDRVLVFEAKLSFVPQASRQISKLYSPLLNHIFKLPVLGVVVFKNLTEDVSTIEPGEMLVSKDNLVFWHYVP